VLANLISNACTHTPAGSPIELSLSAVAGRAEVRVVDHGHGVPAEMRDHIFERFTRLDPSRTRASGGAGLGLAIVTAIVAAHRGSARVEPTPGGGATFVVALPLSGDSTPTPMPVPVAVSERPAMAALGAPSVVAAHALSSARSGRNG
jgi:two-component system, OmpR family, sensor kinase